jgi:chromosome segregation ATPase
MSSNTNDSSSKVADDEVIVPKSSSGATSLVNIILLYSTLVGLGAIAGYMTFYAFFNHRFAHLLDDAERRHNSSRQELQDRYTKVVEEHQKCLEDETRVLELFDLRGRLDGQADLAGKHQLLLDKYQESEEHLSHTLSMHEEAQLKYQQLQARVEKKEAELAELESQIDAYNEQNTLLERKLVDQKDEMEDLLKRKEDEINNLRNEIEDLLKEKEDEIIKLKNRQYDCEATQLSTRIHFRQRQDFLCRET